VRPTGRRPEGVQVRHARPCASRFGRPCTCRPTFQAQVWSARDRRPIRKTFATLAAAKAWRQDSQVALRRGTLRAPTASTLAEAAEDWLFAAKEGIVRTRSGDPYKPSALRGYERSLRSHALPELGHLRLSAVDRNRVQDLVDSLVARGRAPSSVRNAILPLRAIYRRAVARCEVAVNPTLGLALPAVRGRRERIARPGEAASLIAALGEPDRALWATALYAGLRRGELQALRWQDVDFELGIISVERGWDRVVGPIEPKSRAGRRRVPLSAGLREHLLAHRLRQGRGGEGLVFGATAQRAFDSSTVVDRARRAWQRAALESISLHECRHTYAAFMIAAGVNAKALSAYMGHSSITVTLDRYGHLMPGSEREAAGMLDAFLARAPGPR
jgi:integrase